MTVTAENLGKEHSSDLICWYDPYGSISLYLYNWMIQEPGTNWVPIMSGDSPSDHPGLEKSAVSEFIMNEKTSNEAQIVKLCKLNCFYEEMK